MATSTDPRAGANSAARAPERGPAKGPNTAFRELRGQRSPGEFAAAVRRAAREIGEQVACDARYVGRVEAGEIRCPNYAYERVFRHMFPGLTMAEMGFSAREAVRGRGRVRGVVRPRRTRRTRNKTTAPSTTKKNVTTRRATCCVAHS